MIVKRVSFAYAPTAYADSVYDALRGDARSETSTTASGERFRAFRERRGITFVAGRQVVYLADRDDAAAYVRRLRDPGGPGTIDQRETLADLIERVAS